jgi:putative transposase
VQTCRRELLDRTLIWNRSRLLHARREFEQFYYGHRPHQGIANARLVVGLAGVLSDLGAQDVAQLDARRDRARHLHDRRQWQR